MAPATIALRPAAADSNGSGVQFALGRRRIRLIIGALVLGMGIGGIMQVLVTIVQNGVPHSELGVATSANTFFRSIGGPFGTAIFSNVLVGNLASHLHGLALRSGFSSADVTPATLSHLPDAVHAGVVAAYAASIQTVFRIAVPIAALAVLATWLIPQVELRRWPEADQGRPTPTRTWSRLRQAASSSAQTANCGEREGVANSQGHGRLEDGGQPACRPPSTERASVPRTPASGHRRPARARSAGASGPAAKRAPMLRRLLSPTVLIPAILGISLFGALLAFGNIHQVGAMLSSFQPLYIAAILALFVAYEAVQGTQWSLLLQAEGIGGSWRARLFPYLVGGMARVLPIGNYFQNYLLLREEGTDFGRSSAATTLSVLIEVAVCLTGLVLLGIDTWTWLRPLIVGGLALFVLTAWLLYRRYHGRAHPRWFTCYPAICVIYKEVQQFRAGAVALLRPAVLCRAVPLGATYLVLGGSTLFLVVRALGIGSLSYGQVLAAYFFSIAFALIFPLPVDIGLYEASGTGALLADGLSRGDAVSAMLLMRLFTTGTAVAIALATLVVLHDQTRLILRRQRQSSGWQKLHA